VIHAALVFLLAAQTAPAAGEDWHLVARAGDVGDQDAFYTDRASIRRDGDRVRVNEAREGERISERGV